jgi:hypothetical protein
MDAVYAVIMTAALLCCGYLLAKVGPMLFLLYPVEIRIVTKSDWTTFRVASGANIVLIDDLQASPGADVAEYTDQLFRLTQVANDESECEVVEMTVKAQMSRPFTQVVHMVVPSLALLLFGVAKVEFEIERGHWGWTHVQISNCLDNEPVVVENYWWSGVVTESNMKAVSTLRSNIFSRVDVPPQPSVNVNTLDEKVMFGYQGWFGCPDDGSDLNGWFHWFKDQTPSASELGVDMWPDVSELEPDERFPTGMVLPDGSPAELYSSYKQKTMVRHFKWMEDYGLDGVFVQRFVSELDLKGHYCFRNKVIQNARMGAEKHGRVFAVMYDISGSIGFVDKIKSDWQFLVDVLKVTESPNYLRHNGKPVVAVWGLGFNHINQTPSFAQEVVDWLKTGAPSQCRATVMGGVPTYWRTRTNDSRPDDGYEDVYLSLDVISPWTVGRYTDLVGANNHMFNLLIPDLAEANANNVDYMPVVWPGFSWYNLFNGTSPLNQIPRNQGDFYWRQIYNAILVGAKMIYVAMYDECDESTAMYKLARSQTYLPVGASLVPLNIDGHNIASDWYLQLGGQTGQMLRGDIPLTSTRP